MIAKAKFRMPRRSAEALGFGVAVPPGRADSAAGLCVGTTLMQGSSDDNSA
jgi:hypothetical protein